VAYPERTNNLKKESVEALLIQTYLFQSFCVFSDSSFVPLETVVQNEVAEKQWPLALNVLKHSQFPWFIVQATGILENTPAIF
jgi:hypothetical protein